MSMNKQKRDPDERVAHMNEVFDKYVVPMLLFSLAVILVFGVASPVIRSCSAKKEPELVREREYSSAEFYVRRSLLLDGIASYTDVFEQSGCLVVENDSGNAIYAELDGGDEILENVLDPNGNVYSAVMSADSYGKAKEDQNLTLMIYSGSLFLAIAEEEDGTHSALFDNESFDCTPSNSDGISLLDKVPPSEWSRMLEEYKQWLTPMLRQAEGAKIQAAD